MPVVPRHLLASLAVTRSGPNRTLAGKLVRADLGKKGGYSPVKGATVLLQARKHGKWVTRRTVTTSASGAYTVTLKVGPRSWRAVHAGISTTASRTSFTVTKERTLRRSPDVGVVQVSDHPPNV